MTTYIKLEDVQKILINNEDKWIDWDRAIYEIEKEINSLPSINPESMIEEMIEKEEWKSKCIKKDDYTIWFMHWLKASKERLQKFKS